MNVFSYRFLRDSCTIGYSVQAVVAFSFFLVLICFMAPSAQAKTFGLRQDGKLDQEGITKAYKESDWEHVISALEKYLRRNGDSKVEIDERIFAYKYLGVIYAADSLTRSKAESYFTRLLNLSPQVEIVDLFASKRVNELFRAVKRDNEEVQRYNRGFDTYGHVTQTSNGRSPKAETNRDSMPIFNSRDPESIPHSSVRDKAKVQEKKNTWVWWTVGLAAVAGAGVGAFYLSSEPSDNLVETTVVKTK